MSEENIGNGLEVAVWEALEDAGCDPSTYEGIIGVYAGGTSNRWWEVLTIISGKTEVVGRGSEGRLIHVKEGSGFAVESELAWIDEYLPADELKLKLKNISGIGPIWPVIVNYLEEKRYRVEKVREFMPAHFVRIMPNADSLGTRELIFYLDMGRTLARARESSIPENKLKVRLCYIEASGSAGRFVEGWRRYFSRGIQSYRVEGDHFSMLKGATAARSAKALDRALHLE